MIFHTLIFAAAVSSAFVAADNTRRAQSLGLRGSELVQDGEWTLTCQDNQMPSMFGTSGDSNCEEEFEFGLHTNESILQFCNRNYIYTTDSEAASEEDSNNNDIDESVVMKQTYRVVMWMICQEMCAPHIEKLPCSSLSPSSRPSTSPSSSPSAGPSKSPSESPSSSPCPKDTTTTFQIQTETEDCQWVAKGDDSRTRFECQKHSGNILVSELCPVACKEVDEDPEDVPTPTPVAAADSPTFHPTVTDQPSDTFKPTYHPTTTDRPTRTHAPTTFLPTIIDAKNVLTTFPIHIQQDCE